MKSQPTLQAVFFDLDGTLLDTAPDLADACNQVLGEFHRPPVPLTEFRHWVHGGAKLMICASFKMDDQHPDFATIKSAFIRNYQQNLTRKTQLFTGIEQVLTYLEHSQIPWGVVTNKLAALAEPLLAHFGLAQRCCCLISGDTVANTKPHPAQLLHACQVVHTQPEHCLYVGDTLGDIQAAQAAGMHSIAVGYGYRPKNSKMDEWQADAIAATPEELLATLQTQTWRKS